MCNIFFGLVGLILGAILGWFIERNNIIFQEYRNVTTKFRDILVGIYSSIDRLEFDDNTNAAKFVVGGFTETNLLYTNLILITRNIRRKNKIIEAYNNYKIPYEIEPEKAKPFIQFDPDWKTKEYQKHYRYKDIPNGINIAKKNIKELIHIITFYKIFSFSVVNKEKT